MKTFNDHLDGPSVGAENRHLLSFAKKVTNYSVAVNAIGLTNKDKSEPQFVTVSARIYFSRMCHANEGCLVIEARARLGARPARTLIKN